MGKDPALGKVVLEIMSREKYPWSKDLCENFFRKSCSSTVKHVHRICCAFHFRKMSKLQLHAQRSISAIQISSPI